MPGWFIVQALSIDMDQETGSNPGFVRKEKKKKFCAFIFSAQNFKYPIYCISLQTNSLKESAIFRNDMQLNESILPTQNTPAPIPVFS